jgi:hypothetical protein
MEVYIGSLLMITAGMVGSQPLFPESIGNVIKTIEENIGSKILLGIILLLAAIYVVIDLILKGFDMAVLPPFSVLLMIVYLIMFPLIVGFIFSYDFIISKIQKATEKELQSDKITNFKILMSNFEVFFSVGLFFQGIFLILGALSIQDIMELVFAGFR